MITVTFILGVLVIAAWWMVEPTACTDCGHLNAHDYRCPQAVRRDEGWADPLDDPYLRGLDEDRYLDGLTGENRRGVGQ